jgi:fatty-acyl-CoA synthase
MSISDQSISEPAVALPAASYWPATTDVDLDVTTVGALLRRVATEVPDRIGLVDGPADPAQRRRWTYAEMLDAAESVAAALLARFRPGERVAVWESNRAEWVLLQMGAALAGIVVVTINPQYRTEELRYALGQSGSVGIVHGTEHRGVSMTGIVESVRDELPDLRETICFADWDAFVASGDRSTPLPDVSPDDPNLIIYTSGTTGFAKGALLHNLGVVNASRLSAERAGFRDGDAWINPIPLFHTGGGVLASIGTLARRGVHVVVPQFDPALVLELMETERGALILTVPTILLGLLDHPDRPARDVSALRTVMCGGAKVPADLVRRTKSTWGCDFSILFGQAEMHGVLTQTFPTDSDDDQAETLGRPMPHVEVKIADPSGAPVAVGAEGEICARGYQNMMGYWNMPDATGATIDADGWLHSGDVGTMDERGYLRIAGRLKDLVIRGGENIHPLEVEELLLEHEKVAEVAIIGIPDPKWGEQVGAVVQPADPTDPPTPDELFTFCRSRLAPFKTPKLWYFVDTFPRTPSGKIQKFVLRDRVASGELREWQ